jgi:phospholipid transport system substrate-binding protein
MTIRKLVIVFSFSLLGILTGALPVAGAVEGNSTGSRQVVDRLHTALIAAMKGGRSLGFEGRYDLLKPVIEQSFDMPYIAQLSLGSYWSGLSPDQRQQFIQILMRYSIANYAAEFDSYDGGNFQTDSVQSTQPGVETVNSRFTSGTAKHHQFDYLLRKTPEGWRIFNVIVDGVSDLSLKRSQYTYVMGAHGFDDLISRLKDSIKKLSGSSG